MDASENDAWFKFYASVGQLVVHFASLETYLSAALRFNLNYKLDPDFSPRWMGYTGALLGSLRLKDSRDTIYRVITEEAALSDQQIAALKAVFEHVGNINALRDKLAHQHTLWHPKKAATYLISDAFSTRRFNEKRMWEISQPAINSAAHDLIATLEWFGDHRHSVALFKALPTVPPAWRYIPSELKLLRPDRARALRALLRLKRPIPG